MVDGQNFFDQPVKNDIKTCDNIQKIKIGQEYVTELVVCWTVIIPKTNIRW